MGVTNKPWPKDGEECDWVSEKYRRVCKVVQRSGVGKSIKRRMNKRFRKEWKIENGVRD